MTTIINNKYQLIKEIGKGAFGAVFFGKIIDTNEFCAIKKIGKQSLITYSNQTYFNNEVYLLKHMPTHKNIIRYFDIKETLSSYYVVLEYCNGGSLEEALNKYTVFHGTPFTEEITRYVITEILHGLEFLNENNIIHRDIKTENILLHYENQDEQIESNILKARVKICDFGFAKILQKNQVACSVIGTPLFMDPLLLENSTSNSNGIQYDSKVDVWSVGIITYQLLMGVLPFNGKNFDDLISSVKQRKFILPKEKKKIFLTKGAIRFIDKLLTTSYELRKTPKALLEDDWIKGVPNAENSTLMKLKEKINEKEILSFEMLWEEKEKKKVKALPAVKRIEKKKTNNVEKDQIDSLLNRIFKLNERQKEEDTSNQSRQQILSTKTLKRIVIFKSNGASGGSRPSTPIKEENMLLHNYEKKEK